MTPSECILVVILDHVKSIIGEKDFLDGTDGTGGKYKPINRYNFRLRDDGYIASIILNYNRITLMAINLNAITGPPDLPLINQTVLGFEDPSLFSTIYEFINAARCIQIIVHFAAAYTNDSN